MSHSVPLCLCNSPNQPIHIGFKHFTDGDLSFADEDAVADNAGNVGFRNGEGAVDLQKIVGAELIQKLGDFFADGNGLIGCYHFGIIS